jgi:hypothetical protein
MKLLYEWKLRLKLYEEGNKLYVEANKLYAKSIKLWEEGDKLRVEGIKLWEEGDKLCAEGNKLYIEGDKLWEKGILSVYGNTLVQWKNWNKEFGTHECHLENGDVYGFDNKKVD